MPVETLEHAPSSQPPPEIHPEAMRPHQPGSFPSEAPGELPFYALDESEIRARIATALSEKPVDAPLIYLSRVGYDEGQTEDVDRAWAQAHAEHPYRTAAKAKWDEALSIIEPFYTLETGRWSDLVRHPIRTLKATKKVADKVLLEMRAEQAAQIVGEQYDKMVAAALPFVPKLEIPDLFHHGHEPAKTAPTPEAEAVAQHAEQKHALATEQIISQLRLDAQLGEQMTILSTADIIQPLSNGELGFSGPDGREYPAPTPAQLRELVERNLDLIRYKAGQGFTRLLAVPTAIGQADLEARMKDATIDHFRNGSLHDSNCEPVQLNDYYKTHDAESYELIPGHGEKVRDLDSGSYSDRGHSYHGKHRKEDATTRGWELVLVRNLPEMPQHKRDLVFVGGRPEFLPGAKPKQYLEFLHTHPALRGESGFTLKMWYAYALTELERDDTLIDTYGGTMLLGSYVPGQAFSNRRSVPWIGWGRTKQRVESSTALIRGAMPQNMRDISRTLSMRTAVALK